MNTFFGLIFTVPHNHVVLIERLGKFRTVLRAGLNFKIPILDQIRSVDGDWGDVANKSGVFIELSEQQTDTPARQCQTHDNVTLAQVDASVYWTIKSPSRALYEVDHLPRSVHDTALNALRAEVGRTTLDDLLAERDRVSESIAASLAPVMKEWGVALNRVDIQEIVYDDKTATAMRQQMEAERSARAEVLRSSGEAKALLERANAQKHAAVIKAEGEAEATTIRAEAESGYLWAPVSFVSPFPGARFRGAWGRVRSSRRLR